MEDELKPSVNESELSALYACMPDVFREFSIIYGQLMSSLAEAARTRNYHQLLEQIDDLAGAGGRLRHIVEHFRDAEAGFEALIRLLERKATMTNS